MRGWQRRHSQIDSRAVDGYTSAAALRTQAIRNVHLRHDLDTRYEWDADGLRQHHDLLEHAVDAIADSDSILASFQVDVAGTGRDALAHDVIDQLDDGTLCLLFIEVGTCVVGVLDDRLDGRLRRLVDQFADGRARRIDLLDAREDAVGRSERHSNRASSGERESLLAVEVVWVGSGDIQSRRRDG